MGILISAVEISLEYQRLTAEIVGNAEQLLELTVPAASEAVYELDPVLAENLIAGLIRNDLFLEVEILDEFGVQLAGMVKPRETFEGFYALLDITPVQLNYSLPLLNEEDAEGRLTAILDVQSGLSTFFSLALITTIAQLFQAVGISIVLFLIVIYSVTQPVVDLSDKFSKIEIGSKERLTTYASHENDEIGQLVQSANKYLNTAAQFQQNLADSRRNLQNVLNNLREGVIAADDDGRITLVNTAIEQLFGYTESDVVGSTLDKLIAIDAAVDFSDLKVRAASNTSLIVEGQHSSGSTFPVEVSATSVKFIDGQRTVWTIRDISERVKAEQDQWELEAKLRQSQKMEAVGTLAGGIAHDFNNILAGVMGFTELAQLDAAEDEQLSEYLANSLSGLEKASQLVNRILAYSRKMDENAKLVDLKNVVEEFIPLIRQTIPSSIDITTEFSGDSFTVLADEVALDQILMNLFTNSAAAIGSESGSIHLELQQTGRDQVSPLGEYLLLTVSDSGPGIPPDVIHRVFEPYFTTKEGGAGTGMGLSLVHSIVENLGGSIAVENLSSGTRFSVSLPYSRSSIEETTSEPESPSVAEGGHERILLVEDDELLANMLYKFLTNLGYETTLLHDGNSALAEYENSSAGYDLIITDQTMPGMNGDILIRKVLQLNPQQATILCTGFSDSIDEDEAMVLGVRKFLMKPVSITKLGTILREVFDAET